MKLSIAPWLFLSLGLFATCHADEPQPVSAQTGDLPAVEPPVPAADVFVDAWAPGGGCSYPPGRVWIGTDFMLWWTKGERLPPLLTTSPFSPPIPFPLPGNPESTAGALGQPGTSVLFGDHSVDAGVRPGFRANLGGWLTQDQTTGIESNFFYLGTLATRFSAASEGVPILARPFIFEDPTDPRFGQNGSVKTAFPGLVKGSFQAATSSGLLGTDVYLRQRLYCGNDCRLDVLAGYRYLRLREGLEMLDTEISTDPANAFGIPFVVSDGFQTRNEFNGGELGLIGECQFNRLVVRGVAKVAFGCTERTVDIHGSTRIGTLPVENGGFLALPSNIGHYDSTVFSVVPEVGVELGYAVTPRLRVFTGYTFLYWTRVARPGDQIDLHINSSQTPLGAGLVGLPLPGFNLHASDFWAQGLNIGLEFRF